MKCLKLLAAAALLSVSTVASAQLYLFAGAGGGNPKFDGGDFPLFNTRRNDTKDVTYHLGVGYRFSPNWAVEIGGADLGDYSIHLTDFVGGSLRGTYKVQGFKAAVVGSYPFTERFSMFAKLGLGSTKAEFEATTVIGASGTVTPFVAEERRNDVLAGFGAQYMIWRNLGVRAEYENWGRVGNQTLFPGDPTHTGEAKMSSWNVLAVFTF